MSTKNSLAPYLLLISFKYFRSGSFSNNNVSELASNLKSLEKKIESLESKLAGLIEGIEAASKLKAELDEAKLKLGSEVKELKENAKSWLTKQKEAIDSNNDGKVDLEEIYSYVRRRMTSRYPQPKK